MTEMLSSTSVPEGSRIEDAPRRSRALGRVRLGLLYLFVAALVALARPTPAFLLGGAIVALLGEGVRLWAAGHLQKSIRLVTGGPYAHTQNPLYLGRLLIWTGLGMAARTELYLNLAAVAAGHAVFFYYYLPRKRHIEGLRLARRHGKAFEVYRHRVPVLFPSLRRYPGTGERWSFRRMVSNQEPLVLAGLLAALGVLAWKVGRAAP
jgi:protein-S-isoprenylcysteine O-methyltransferase Ste14